MTTTFEKLVIDFIREKETLWSVYHFKDTVAAVTDQRVFFVVNDIDKTEVLVDIHYSKIKGVSIRRINSHRNTVNIYYNELLYSLSIETSRVDRFVNDVLKHKVKLNNNQN